MVDELRQREPRVEDKAFLAYVRLQRCCVCGAPQPSQAAHIRMACPERGKRATGKGEKPSDCWAVPLCQSCHQDGPQAQHRGAEAAFWRRVGVDPLEIAVAFYAQFNGARPMMEPGVECEFIMQGGRQRRPTPALDPELYVLPRPSKNRTRIKNPRKAGSRNFIFSTDKSKPKRKWPKRHLHGTMKFPKGRKIARRR